jgi:hypothetical protein
MQALDVKIGDKTYHVVVPSIDAAPLEVIVDGLPFQVCVCDDEADKKAQSAAPAYPQPVPDHTAVLNSMTMAYRAKLSCYSRNGD